MKALVITFCLLVSCNTQKREKDVIEWELKQVIENMVVQGSFVNAMEDSIEADKSLSFNYAFQERLSIEREKEARWREKMMELDKELKQYQ